MTRIRVRVQAICSALSDRPSSVDDVPGMEEESDDSSQDEYPIPSTSSGAAPSQLIHPVLHSAPSLSSFKVYSSGTTPLSGSPPNALATIDSVETLIGLMVSGSSASSA